jgi:hypothetical protein
MPPKATMTLLAEVASGETDWADIFFLVGLILFLIAGFLLYPRPSNPPIGHSVLALGLAAVALGFLLL